jgi:hypothetical protein
MRLPRIGPFSWLHVLSYGPESEYCAGQLPQKKKKKERKEEKIIALILNICFLKWLLPAMKEATRVCV